MTTETQQTEENQRKMKRTLLLAVSLTISLIAFNPAVSFGQAASAAVVPTGADSATSSKLTSDPKVIEEKRKFYDRLTDEQRKKLSHITANGTQLSDAPASEDDTSAVINNKIEAANGVIEDLQGRVAAEKEKAEKLQEKLTSAQTLSKQIPDLKSQIADLTSDKTNLYEAAIQADKYTDGWRTRAINAEHELAEIKKTAKKLKTDSKK